MWERRMRRGGGDASRLAAGEITSGGLRRTYYLHVPHTYSAGAPTPLVIALHGHFGNGRNMEGLSHFAAIADRSGFIVAYPDGIDRGWNDGRVGANEGIDDIAFFRDLIALLQSHYSIDANRIYATGMSNGGFMSYRSACELGGQIAAIATVAATMGEALASTCRPARPMSVCLIQGTADPFVLWNGGPVAGGRRGRGWALSVDETVKYWVEVNGCDSTPRSMQLPILNAADPTRIFSYQYLNGREGAEVILYRIENGGHTWPGGLQYLPVRMVGPASSQMDASQVIWDFFFRHARNS